MLLGDVISQFSNGGVTEEVVLGLSDLVLLAELRAQAEANGCDLGTYAAAAVNRYASEASDEEWVSLMGAMNRAQDPGSAYLERALAFMLRRPP